MRQSVAAAVTYLSGKILITLHPPNSRRELSGMWEFPGGKAEFRPQI